MRRLHAAEPGLSGAQARRKLKEPVASVQDVASYIADVTAELATLAASSKLDTLSYLLSVSSREARFARKALQARSGLDE